MDITQSVFRIEPNMPVTAYKTYAFNSPQSTHFREATCQEVDCPMYLKGWRMAYDLSDPAKAKAANWIRLHSGRKFTSDESVPGKVILTFHSGQQCFTKHTVPLDRPAIFISRGGDWRATTEAPQKLNAEDWVDSFANHQDRLATRLAQG